MDPKTFYVLNRSFTKDKNGVYHYGDSKIEGADPETFEIVSGNYQKDKTGTYRDGKRETFKN